MPFIDKDRRPLIDEEDIPVEHQQPGDRCYRYYKEMVRWWKESPRWTTAHEIYKDLLSNYRSPDEYTAHNLAWQVFFQLYVIPYEQKKREENGDVD